MELNNINIEDNKITGIVSDKDNIKNILLENSYLKDKEISYVKERNFLTKTVSDEFYLIKNNIKEKDNFLEKLLLSITMVGFNEDYLEREIATLSKTEKILISIALSLIMNPDILIFSNIFKDLDRNNKLIIKKIILELKRKYNKTIIIIDNINILYEICDYLIIIKDDKIVLNDKKKEIVKYLDLLIENDINIPFFIEFSNIAKKYNKDINYYQDINDLIKGVYKNVR